MDTGIVSGLLGGAVAVVICTAAAKAAQKKATDGQLKHGLLMLVLGFGCLPFCVLAGWAFFNDNDAHEKASELIAIVGLFTGFGIGAAYCFAEYYKVHGTFDSEKIEFHTPWTGTKTELWNNLVSAEFNTSMYWYALKFKSGKTIRLSSYLHGHGEVLDILKHRGFPL